MYTANRGRTRPIPHLHTEVNTSFGVNTDDELSKNVGNKDKSKFNLLQFSTVVEVYLNYMPVCGYFRRG